jgi:hypothetical protein
MENTYSSHLSFSEGRLIFQYDAPSPASASDAEPEEYRVVHYNEKGRGESREQGENDDPTQAQREAVLSREKELKQLINDTKIMLGGYYGDNFFEKGEGNGRIFAGEYEELVVYASESKDYKSPGPRLKMQYNALIRHLDTIQNPTMKGEHYDAPYQYAKKKRDYLSLLQESMQQMKPKKSENMVERSRQNLDEARSALELAAADYKNGVQEGRNYDALVGALDKAQERVEFEEDLIRLLGIQDQGLHTRLRDLRTLRDTVRNEATRPLVERSDGSLDGYNIFNDPSMQQARDMLNREWKFRGMKGPRGLNASDEAYAQAMANLGMANPSVQEREAHKNRINDLFKSDEMLEGLPAKRDAGMKIVREIAVRAAQRVGAHRQGRQELSVEDREALYADGRRIREGEKFFKHHHATGEEPEMKELYRGLDDMKEVVTFVKSEEAMQRVQPLLDEWRRMSELDDLQSVSTDEIVALVKAGREQRVPLETNVKKVEALPDSPHKQDLVQRMRSALEALEGLESSAGIAAPLPLDPSEGELIVGPTNPYDQPVNPEEGSIFNPDVPNPEGIVINPPSSSLLEDPTLDPFDPRFVPPKQPEQYVEPANPEHDELPSREDLLTQVKPIGPGDEQWPEGREGRTDGRSDGLKNPARVAQKAYQKAIKRAIFSAIKRAISFGYWK